MVPLAKQELAFDDSHSEKTSLDALLESMKPSFLPKEENKEIIRQVCIAPGSDTTSPFFLIKKEHSTFLFGTGFSQVSCAGKTYPSFPDMRLPFAEKDSLVAWIILDDAINVDLLTTVLPVLNFPHIYTTRQNIASIRNNISDAKILDKCRFFEIIDDNNQTQKIGTIEYGISQERGHFCLRFDSRVFAYPYTPSALSSATP